MDGDGFVLPVIMRRWCHEEFGGERLHLGTQGYGQEVS
jgi:hypothetical protein